MSCTKCKRSYIWSNWVATTPFRTSVAQPCAPFHIVHAYVSPLCLPKAQLGYFAIYICRSNKVVVRDLRPDFFFYFASYYYYYFLFSFHSVSLRHHNAISLNQCPSYENLVCMCIMMMMITMCCAPIKGIIFSQKWPFQFWS